MGMAVCNRYINCKFERCRHWDNHKIRKAGIGKKHDCDVREWYCARTDKWVSCIRVYKYKKG
jgi:hypothetical protein